MCCPVSTILDALVVYFFTHARSSTKMAPKKTSAPKEAPVALGPQVAEGENVFGVAHIFAS